MSKIKQYFKDYAIAQKACNEFNKKHWLGTLILSSMVGVITYVGILAFDKIQEKKYNKLMNEVLEKSSEEGEA